MENLLANPVSRMVWESKYRFRIGGEPVDRELADTWRRVAHALAASEADAPHWEARFLSILEGFRFLPGGRILAGAGTGREVTLFNCFVMGLPGDSMSGIFDALKEGAITMQQGGGVGYDFSTLRPAGAPARRVGSIASGPVSFMRVWDSMCATVLSTGARRGAMMATLRCDHPDIETFIDAKADPRELRHFNLSVQASDAFMQAVERDESWPLLFPLDDEEEGETLPRRWPGYQGEVPCRVYRRVPARELWQRIMRATYDYAEPGIFFVDRANRSNNLWYDEQITATNPCGEIPLPPYGACDLGSVNLTRFVHGAFTPAARLDLDALQESVGIGVRLMDNVIDASRFPLPAQAERARGTRRIGLGLTGLADTLIMLGLHYASEAGRRQAAAIMATICHSAYRASIELAREKGSFPYFQRDRYLESPFIRALPEAIREGIARYGIRNSHLTAIAPTGTISLLADNVSSGIEPVFAYRFSRRILEPDGTPSIHEVSDYAYRRWRKCFGPAPLPATFVEARSLSPFDHLKMQAALQPFVDNAVSKTINVPRDYPFDKFKALYREAYQLGLKGCTTFRENPVSGAVLESPVVEPRGGCCTLEREDD
ncbi:MAG TPA: adenosylcobalamin-dependent ribonucleoside-diphosphate reductase [Gammaproteobacteria bacterium]|jgi:ribonucleoside-diphosphate reductase alpha chain